MKDIILIGGGGHCRSVIDVIEQEGLFSIVGIVDRPEKLGKKVLGYPIIGDDSDLSSLTKRYQYALVTVGQIKSASLRVDLFNRAVKAGFSMPSIVSPHAYVSKSAVLGKGTIVMHSALVNTGTTIGDNCIINSKALIEHDCHISEHCHISTNVTVNGGSTVGRESFVGSGAITRELAVIDNGSFVKAGSLVL